MAPVLPSLFPAMFSILRSDVPFYLKTTGVMERM